jgi:hypothetical protein
VHRGDGSTRSTTIEKKEVERMSGGLASAARGNAAPLAHRLEERCWRC